MKINKPPPIKQFKEVGVTCKYINDSAWYEIKPPDAIYIYRDNGTSLDFMLKEANNPKVEIRAPNDLRITEENFTQIYHNVQYQLQYDDSLKE